ncbi:hypothetical protein [Asanoa iriomotensis]|uniref:Uncharacterized protein n=1 Tax=Asanoa iriomotensis TaxID=234613 RepID=A0ABQ4C753_9ACTN|nr:hypothetical protein [Asanoa iriomotensis]GIF58135.1 hypothetical protein Air01nite_42300 [Asanoa iriomotensis]
MAVAESACAIGAVRGAAFFLGPAATAGVLGYIVTHGPEPIQGSVDAAINPFTKAALPFGP